MGKKVKMKTKKNLKKNGNFCKKRSFIVKKNKQSFTLQ